MTEGVREKKRWPWWGKLLLALSPIFVLLVIVMVFEAGGRRSYNEAMQEARDIGGPVTFEEIEAARKVWLEDQNGALVILKVASDLLRIDKASGVEILPIFGISKDELGPRWSAETLRIVRSFLDQHATTLAEIDRLRGYEGGRFPFEIKPDPVETFTPDREALRQSAKLVLLRLQYRTMLGDTSRVVEDTDLLFRHAHLLDGEPTLVLSLMRVAIDALAVAGIESILSWGSLPPEQMLQLEQLLSGVEQIDRLGAGYQGERASFIAMTEAVISGGSGGADAIGRSRPVVSPVQRGLLQMDRAAGLRMYNRLAKAVNNQQRLAADSENQKEVNSLPGYCVVTRMMIPSFSRAVVLDWNCLAMYRSARTALAIERFRFDHGRFPRRLEELVPRYMPALLTDPFDDKLLRYRVDADAVIIYSIGEDGTDDGGYVIHRTAHGTSPTDWGFVLLKPEFRGRPASTTAPATREN